MHDQLVGRHAAIGKKEAPLCHLRRFRYIVDLQDKKRRIAGQWIRGGRAILIAGVMDIQQIDHALILKLRLPLEIDERPDGRGEDQHDPHENGNEFQPQFLYHVHEASSGAVR